MKHIRKQLEKLREIRRHQLHPLVHSLHKKHKISKKTLFYVKEYGPHANVSGTIVRESLKILLLASIISAFGGFALENIKESFIIIIPLVVLLPALNDMIGDYGTIISSRFSTMLHEGRVKKDWASNPELVKLFFQVIIISLITAVLASGVALFVSHTAGFTIGLMIALKILFISIVDVVLLVSILFLISVAAGLYFYKKKEDPNNFLIPITTSVADFGNMVILAVLVVLLF